jgi:hypothetical protein
VEFDRTTRSFAPLRGLQGGRGKQSLIWGAAMGAVIALALIHRTVATTPIASASRLTPLARLGDLLLTAAFLLLAHALGQQVFRLLRLAPPRIEGIALATALGLGVLTGAAYAFGKVGAYRPLPLILLLAGCALLVRHQLRAALADLAAAAGRLPDLLRGGGGAARVVAVLLFASMLFAVVGALTPPHHHDPLAYHLSLPQYYLQTGQIAVIPEIGPSTLPLNFELLFGFGLALGSESFSQLLHLACALLTGLMLWGLASRTVDRTTGWLSLAIFFGTPLVPIWARVANNDLALGYFIFAAMLAASYAVQAQKTALQRERWRWLAVAGVFAGLALGTKYQGAFAIAPLGLLIVCDSYRTASGRMLSFARTGAAIRSAAVFGGAAFLVALPWLWPNAPLLIGWVNRLIGVQDTSKAAQAINLDYYLIRGLTLSPRTPLGYLLLPVRAYLRGDFEQRFVVPHPLFLLLPLLVLLPAFWRRREVVYAAVVAGGFSFAWAMGIQELRYLLAICAPLALCTAAVLRAGWERPVLRRAAFAGLIVSALLTFGLTFLHVGADRPVKILLGLESRDDYLRRSASVGATYRATSFLAERQQPHERTLFVHEIQIYYIPSTLQVRTSDAREVLFLLGERFATPQEAIAYLQGESIGYILVNEADFRWWLQADPEGRLAQGKANFDRFAANLEPVYRDGRPERPNLVIYRVPPR